MTARPGGKRGDRQVVEDTVDRSFSRGSLISRGAVTVDDSTAVGRNVHTAEAVGITGDHVTRVVPVVVAVIDLRPGVAAVDRSVVPTHGADLAGEVDRRIVLAGGSHTETDAVGKHYVRELGEAGTAVG